MKIKEEIKNIESTFQEQVTTFLSAAFGFVAGLAWNDAISTFINYIFPSTRNTIIAKFIYAVLITLIAVIILTSIKRFSKPSTITVIEEEKKS
jgi:C4-dicarboxylate transporter